MRIVVDAVAGEPAAFAPFHERIIAMHRNGAERMIQRAVRRGELPADLPDAFAQAFIEALFGAVLLHALALPAEQREQARRHAAEHAAPLVDFVLASVHARITGPADHAHHRTTSPAAGQ